MTIKQLRNLIKTLAEASEDGVSFDYQIAGLYARDDECRGAQAKVAVG